MTINEYQKNALRTANKSLPPIQQLENGLMGLNGVMQMNVDKLRARYPDGFDTEHSLHRQQNDI